jgi:hypothetical protein
MDINPEDENAYTTQFHKVFLKYMENEYCAKQGRLPVIKSESIHYNNPFSSAMDSRCGRSSHDAYELSSNDGEYTMHKKWAKQYSDEAIAQHTC